MKILQICILLLIPAYILEKDDVNRVSNSNGNESYFSIWAEENSSIAANAYEWAFGNGSDCPAGKGVVVYVPPGYECYLVSMGLSLNAGTGTVQAVINGASQGNNANVSVSAGNSAINDVEPIAISSGDVVSFRTQAASGTSGPCIAVMWFKLIKQ
jgi:hypothetical protein